MSLSPQTAAARLERALDAVCRAAGWLALPLALLLFLQWPLRSFSGGQPQLANDLGQILFALYVALALRHTTRRGAHLGAHRQLPHWLRAATLGGVLLPWCALLLWMGTPLLLQSLGQLERFPETLHPGYFLIKLAAWLMVAAMALQAAIDLARLLRGGAPRS